MISDCEMKKDGEDAGWEATQDSEVGSTGGNYGSSTGGTPLQVGTLVTKDVPKS